MTVIFRDYSATIYVCADHQKPMVAEWSEIVAAKLKSEGAAPAQQKPSSDSASSASDGLEAAKQTFEKRCEGKADSPIHPSADAAIAAWEVFDAARTVGGPEPTTIEICYLSSSVTDDDKKCRTCALTSDRAVTFHANGYTTTIYFCWEHEKQMAKRADGTFAPINGLSPD